MIKNPRYTFGGESSKSELIKLRVHFKGRSSVSKAVKSGIDGSVFSVHGSRFTIPLESTSSSKTRDA